MDFTVADVAAAIETEPRPTHRAALERLALSMLLVGVGRWRLARLRALACRARLDATAEGGEDEQRDGAAA